MALWRLCGAAKKNGFVSVGTGLFSWGWRLRNGFVRWLRADALKTFELLDGAAVMALRLSLIAQEQRPAIGLADHAVKPFTQEKISVLSTGDFDVTRGELRAHQEHGLASGVERLIETSGKKA